MDNENKSTVEQDEISLPKSVEVDKIIEFYKNIEDSSENDTTDYVKEEQSSKFKHLLFFKKKATQSADGIETSVYGLSEKGRIYLYRAISAAISICIIIGSFVLAYFLPGNKDIISKKQNELRKKDEYVKIESIHTTLTDDVEYLKTTNAEKKKTIEQLDDPENTKAALRTEISEKKTAVGELESQKEAKEAELKEINESIAEKAPPETILAPGNYYVGTNIAPGKYLVTGNGKFMVATSRGQSKINTVLGAESLEVTLEENDVLKFESKVKFVATN